MQLIQILLPVYDQAGKRFPRKLYKQTAVQLAREFGGVTAYVHTPAEGLWRPSRGRLERDDIVVLEVMAERCDRRFWARRRRELASAFEQDVIVIRALRFARL